MFSLFDLSVGSHFSGRETVTPLPLFAFGAVFLFSILCVLTYLPSFNIAQTKTLPIS